MGKKKKHHGEKCEAKTKETRAKKQTKKNKKKNSVTEQDHRLLNVARGCGILIVIFFFFPWANINNSNLAGFEVSKLSAANHNTRALAEAYRAQGIEHLCESKKLKEALSDAHAQLKQAEAKLNYASEGKPEAAAAQKEFETCKKKIAAAQKTIHDSNHEQLAENAEAEAKKLLQPTQWVWNLGMVAMIIPCLGLVSVVANKRFLHIFTGCFTLAVVTGVLIIGVKSGEYSNIIAGFGFLFIVGPMFQIIAPSEPLTILYNLVALSGAITCFVLFENQTFAAISEEHVTLIGVGLWLSLAAATTQIIAPLRHAKKVAIAVVTLPTLIPVYLFFGMISNTMLLPLMDLNQEPAIITDSTLEERNGIFFQPGFDTPFSGSMSRQYPNGQVSTEASYTNGLKLLQRSWYTNGTMKSEFRFYAGQLAVRRSWQMNGGIQPWKQEGLSSAQLQRAVDLMEGKGVKKNFVQAYVWVYAAATNGHPQAHFFLANTPPGMTQADLAAAKAISDRLLAPAN
ncbi:MAG: hypothetical protein QF685_10460 [Verrucomicrobiota bacterium]|jgi:hypothetical protein|nr:hypothetical protein [Verrucomicrobiota bacterium]